jgi:hypothetical protein
VRAPNLRRLQFSPLPVFKFDTALSSIVHPVCQRGVFAVRPFNVHPDGVRSITLLVSAVVIVQRRSC